MVPVVKRRGSPLASWMSSRGRSSASSADVKAGKQKADDLQGSTFTITSLGAQGGLFATPILNFPEVGILGVHQIKQKPVVRDGQIVIGDVMLLSLSLRSPHRGRPRGRGLRLRHHQLPARPRRAAAGHLIHRGGEPRSWSGALRRASVSPLSRPTRSSSTTRCAAWSAVTLASFHRVALCRACRGQRRRGGTRIGGANGTVGLRLVHSLACAPTRVVRGYAAAGPT
jgi:hypothetical protein